MAAPQRHRSVCYLIWRALSIAKPRDNIRGNRDSLLVASTGDPPGGGKVFWGGGGGGGFSKGRGIDYLALTVDAS